jgi:DNA-binding NarL/FixJ family response regulator
MKTALTATPAKIRVAIIEDQMRTREGLRALIVSSDGFECVGTCGSMEEALAADWRDQANVVLVDLGLPGMSGIEGIAILRRQCPEAALVVLTVYEDNDRVFRALCSGANGYLLKNTAPAKLVEALREANRGGAPMSPEIARLVIEVFRRVHPPEKATHNLTPQELRLLKLLVEGHSYKTAANEMSVSINTVAFHIQNIYGKLQVHSKSEAVARALNENLFR